MKLVVAALFFAVVSSASLAQVASGPSRTFVADPKACPPGSTAHAYYMRQKGRFVRQGWVCERNTHSPS